MENVISIGQNSGGNFQSVDFAGNQVKFYWGDILNGIEFGNNLYGNNSAGNSTVVNFPPGYTMELSGIGGTYFGDAGTSHEYMETELGRRNRH
jgi:hypothetical protein